MREFLLAFQFLTIIPITLRSGSKETEEIGRSSVYFPLVGVCQGLILVLTAFVLSRVLPWELVSILVVSAGILTNGGFHLDGLADTVDGLAGGATNEERLEIMKDPRIGVIGVVAVATDLLLKYAALNNLAGSVKYEVIFLLPVAGRWSMVPMAYWGDYARESGGLGKAFTDNAGGLHLLIATVITLLISFVFIGFKAAVIISILLFTTYLGTIFFRSRLGGVTGDVLGFQSEATEVLFLILAIAFFGGIKQ